VEFPVEDVFCFAVLHLVSHLGVVFEHGFLVGEVLRANESLFFAQAATHLIDG
jgi:hypothetical protein